VLLLSPSCPSRSRHSKGSFEINILKTFTHLNKKSIPEHFVFIKKKSVLLPTYSQSCHFVDTEYSPHTIINQTSTVNKEDKPLQKDSQKTINRIIEW